MEPTFLAPGEDQWQLLQEEGSAAAPQLPQLPQLEGSLRSKAPWGSRRTALMAVSLTAGLCAVSAALAAVGSSLGASVAAPVASSAVQSDLSVPEGKYEASNPIGRRAPKQCIGSTTLHGHGEVDVIVNRNDKLGNPATEVHLYAHNAVAPSLGGRAYFGSFCAEGFYDSNSYASLSLLGRTLSFTIDMGNIGCGCNFAFYLTSMAQNTDATACQDYYCDANNVCGARCDEVDIMEANSKVWRSTLHLADDDVGGAAGYGGTGPHSQTWTSNEYGPGASCIDTNKPFEVKAHFPVHTVGGKRVLQGMMVDLAQDGCEKGLTATVGWYKFKGRDAIVELTESLERGMVPIVSYWSSDKLSWLDGRDINGEDPCPVDHAKSCPTTGPEARDFRISNFTGFIHGSTMNLSPGGAHKKSSSHPAEASGPAHSHTFGASSSSSSVSSAGSEEQPIIMKNGWAKIPYGSKGYYYFNPESGKSSWSVPPEAVR